MILWPMLLPGISDLQSSNGNCFDKELQMPRWRVAVRRCLEYSRTQRWRAELLGRFRTTRFSSAPRFRGRSFAENWARRILPEQFPAHAFTSQLISFLLNGLCGFRLYALRKNSIRNGFYYHSHPC